MKNGRGATVCWPTHARAPPPIARVRATPHSRQHRRVRSIAQRAAGRIFEIMHPRTISRPLPRARCPFCGAPIPRGSQQCPRCTRPFPPNAAPVIAPAGDAERPRPRWLAEALPRHWTPADANGARRWGLSFGAGLFLLLVVGVFAAYMAIDEGIGVRVGVGVGNNARDRSGPGARSQRASDALAVAQTAARPPLSSAQLPLLAEQIAHANADDDADAARLRRERGAQRGTHGTASVPRAAATPAAPAKARHTRRSPAHSTESATPAVASAPTFSSIASPKSAPAASDEAPTSEAAAPVQATSGAASDERDAPPQSGAADKSFNGPIEGSAPPASSDAPPSNAPVAPPKPSDALRPNEHRSVPLEAPSASLRDARGHGVRRGLTHRRKHPPHTATAHAPLIVFTLPRFLIAPTMRMPSFPHPPSSTFDLSENQRALYRGH